MKTALGSFEFSVYFPETDERVETGAGYDGIIEAVHALRVRTGNEHIGVIERREYRGRTVEEDDVYTLLALFAPQVGWFVPLSSSTTLENRIINDEVQELVHRGLVETKHYIATSHVLKYYNYLENQLAKKAAEEASAPLPTETEEVPADVAG